MDLLARISLINLKNYFRIRTVMVGGVKVFHCISEGDKINIPQGCNSMVLGLNHVCIYEGAL